MSVWGCLNLRRGAGKLFMAWHKLRIWHMFSFPLFSSQGLAAHCSCNSLRCCLCPLNHAKVETWLVLEEGLKHLFRTWVTQSPPCPVPSVCKSSEPSLGEAWGACMSAHRPVPKADRQERASYRGLVWIQSWARVWGGSRRATREQQNQPVLLPSVSRRLSPAYQPGLIRGDWLPLYKQHEGGKYLKSPFS